MSKFQRVFRERRLSAEEMARDQEVRRKVQAEYPPASPSAHMAPGVLSEALKAAIQASEKSIDQIADDAGVSQVLLTRFLSGERDIRVSTADKLAEVLGLKLTASARA